MSGPTCGLNYFEDSRFNFEQTPPGRDTPVPERFSENPVPWRAALALAGALWAQPKPCCSRGGVRSIVAPAASAQSGRRLEQSINNN